MTLIEFFDGISIDNMISCVSMKPDKVIFVGEKSPMKKQNDVYLRFLKNKNLNTQLSYKTLNTKNINESISVLSEIVQTEENCVFDLTGGSDLLLVAMGIVFERYGKDKKIQMHRYNVRTGIACDCDSDGIIPGYETPEITVEDNITLYGGCIRKFDGKKGTYDWQLTEDFKADLLKMWNICKTNPGLWNSQICTFSFLCDICCKEISELKIYAKKEYIKNLMKQKNCKFTWLHNYVNSLNKIGVITDFVDNEDSIGFSFKNEQVKLCLTKEGTLLELIVLLFAKQAKENDGSFKFNDAVNGVHIDWDAELHDVTDDEKDTENEIDNILMKGVIPVFISCKNGYVDENELYKLNTVATAFGGPYAKKVLVASYFGNNNVTANKYFVQRAEDMNIQLIENVHRLSNDAFEKKIKNILY